MTELEHTEHRQRGPRGRLVAAGVVVAAAVAGIAVVVSRGDGEPHEGR